MTSKSSFFNLMRENLKRRMALPALITVLFFFLFPVSTLMLVDKYMRNPVTMIGGDADWLMTKRYIYNDFIRAQDAEGWLFALICLLAVISGVNAFRYLHNSRKADFYHSLPVSRAKLYMAAVANSILMTAVPYLVMALISAAITQAKSGYTDCLSYAAGNFLCGMGFFMLIFVMTVLAMLLTGTILTGVMATLVLLFYGPVVICTVDSLMQNYYWSFYRINSALDSLCAHSSPVLWVAIGNGSTAYKASVALVIALLLLMLCLKLYLMRHSETAGTPVAFRLIKTPVKILVTVPLGLLGGIFAGSMTDKSDIWTAFGMLCGVVLAHSIIEIIYNADFKKLFSHKIQFVICLAATFMIWGFFRFDISGYDSFLPDTDKIQSSAAYSYGMESIYGNEDNLELTDDGDSVYVTHNRDALDVLNDMHITDEQLTNNILAIASEGIRQVKEFKAAGDVNEASDYMSDEQMLGIITIAWHMTNGKTIYRNYNFDLSSVSADIEAVHDSMDFKQAVYPLLDKTEAEAADIVGVNYRDAFGVYSIDFDALAQNNEIEELYYTYAEELSKLTAKTRKQESPIAAIQFKSSKFQSLVDSVKENSGYIEYLNDMGDYPIYPSFTKTLELLGSYGIVLNEPLNADRIESIELDSAFANELREEGGAALDRISLTVTDKDEIQEILDSLIYHVNADNNLNPQYYGLYANINFDKKYENAVAANATDINADDVNDAAARKAIATEAEASGENGGSFSEEGEASTANEADSKQSQIRISVVQTYEGASDSSIDSRFVNGLNFDADKIPQFVKEHFDIDEDMLALNTHGAAW